MITPTREKLSFEDYLRYDDGEDNRYELEDGDLILMNPPTGNHALIIRLLYNKLEKEIDRLSLPWFTLQGIGVRVSFRRSRIPDITVVSLDGINEKLEESAVLETPPVLVIEVVSPESRVRDYRYKRAEYGVMGIPEYWIVDPQERRISVLSLLDGLYEEIVYTGDDPIESKAFPELSLTVVEMFLN